MQRLGYYVVILTLFIIQTIRAQSPAHAGSILDGSGGALLNNPSSVFISGHNAYLVSNVSNALEVIDITNPEEPVHAGSLVDGDGGALLKYPVCVYVSGNYAYVACLGSVALEIIDISNPAVPVHKGSITDGTGGAMLEYPTSVVVSGNYAYVTSGSDNVLNIIDVSDPATPILAGKIVNGDGGALLTFPLAVYVSGNYAYVASGASYALEIVDISNPAAPSHKGSLKDVANTIFLRAPSSVFVLGNYAYVTSGKGNALEIIDVSDPATPALKGRLTDNSVAGVHLNDPLYVYVSGNEAYVASSESNALEIVDISDPAAPVHKKSLTDGTGGALLNQPVSLVVSGKYVYIASRLSNAFEIVVMKDPQSITGFVLPSTYSITGTGQINLTGTASSGLPITYLVSSGNASISGQSLNLLRGGGIVIIKAVQPGNKTFAASDTVIQIVNVSDLTCSSANIQTNFTSYVTKDTLYLQVSDEKGDINYHSWTVGGSNFQFTTIIKYPLSTSELKKDSIHVKLLASDLYGCNVIVEKKLILSQITAIEEFNNTNTELKIYPNPTQNEVYIKSSTEGILHIYDLQNRELKKFGLVTGTQKIDLSGISKGIYFYRFSSETYLNNGKIILE